MNTYKQYGRCLLCGRVLRNEESKVRGYGDTCYGRIHKDHKRRLFSIPITPVKEKQKKAGKAKMGA